MKYFLLLAITAFILSCATQKQMVKTDLRDNQTFLLTEVSDDPSYGYSKRKPIKVGGVDKEEGPLNERRFLNALAGPNGETVSYYRAGSCCSFKSKNGFMGRGMLDIYSLTWEDSKDTVSIYINMYDYGELKAPEGFTIRK